MEEKLDTALFKQKLQDELALLENELAHVGTRNPENKDDWVATPGEMDILQSDKNEVADKMEEYEERSGILNELEIQLNEVKAALERIENGTYGICEKGGEQISRERLEALPSARTCVEHAPV